jgi:histidinol phosphatase-like enzyme
MNLRSGRAAVFLDRDSTLNVERGDLKTWNSSPESGGRYDD